MYKKIIIVAKNHTTSEGKKFKSFFTPLKVNGVQKFMTVRFAEGIKTSKLSGKYVLIAKDSDIQMPKFYEPFIASKGERKGKKIYPYIWINEVEKLIPCKSKESEEDKNVQVEFDVDEDLSDLVDDDSADYLTDIE